MTQEEWSRVMDDKSTNTLIDDHQRHNIHKFSFTGTFNEYFGIWFVNVLLTIVTVGVYSAWAKVRNAQYFYNHTFIAKANFQYLADPVRILMGRAIAVVLFMVWQVSANYSLGLSGLLSLLFMLAIPWMIVSSLRFKAVNSAHRNIRFNFQGTYGGALCWFILMPAFCAGTFALLLLGIELFASAVGLYVPEITVEGIYTINWERLWQDIRTYLPVFIVMTCIVFAAGILLYAMFYYKQVQFYAENHQFGRVPFVFTGFLSPVISICAITLFIYLMLMGMSYAVMRVGVLVPDGWPELSLFVLWVVVSIVFASAYFKASTRNYVLSHCRIGNDIYLHSDLSVLKLFVIRLVFGFLTIITIGLLWPLMKIQLARLYANATSIRSDTGVDAFFNAKHEEQQAFGEEAADVFDVGFGV